MVQTQLQHIFRIHLKLQVNIIISIHMLRYFLEEEEPHFDEKTVTIIKKHFIKKRQYRPFHLDCSYSKKKLCYCSQNPIAKLPRTNKSQLWQSYEEIHNFYQQINEKDLNKIQKTFQHCRDKIRKIGKTQVAEFVRKLRSDKNLHMGQNGQYQNA